MHGYFSEKTERFIAPAREKPEWWRVLLTFLILAAVYIGFMTTLFLGLGMIMDSGELNTILLKAQSGVFDTPVALIAVLATFIGAVIGLWVGLVIIHRRGMASLLGPKENWLRNFVLAVVIVALLFGAFRLVFPTEDPMIPNLAFGTWIKWLPLALPLLIIQVGAEELIFRGYLQQQLAVFSKSRFIWAVLPSALFGVLHYEAEQFGPNAGLVVLSTVISGILMAEITMRTGNLGAAIGVHLANNFFAMMVVSLSGDLTGLALYTTPFSAADVELMRWYLITDIALVSVILAGFYVYLWKERQTGLQS